MTCFKIPKAILKTNKAFSLALSILIVLLTILMFALLVLPNYVTEAVNNFVIDYNTPDAYILTNPIESNIIEDYKNVNGILNVEQRFILDKQVILPNGNISVLRLIREDDNSFSKEYIIDELNYKAEFGVSVSSYFAKINNIKVGDKITIKAQSGDKTATVSKIISRPETMVYFRNETSFYDNTNFGYIYLEESDFDNIFLTSNLSNQWLFKINNDVKLEDLEDIIGDNIMNSYMYKDSAEHKIVIDNLDSLKNVTYYIPGMIIFIGITFVCLFLKQIISRSKKMIGILKSQGYREKLIIRIFANYTALVSIPSSILGIFLGFYFTYFLAKNYEDLYSLPNISYPEIPIVLIFIPVILMIISAFCSKGITSVDPADAYQAVEYKNSKPITILSKIKLSPFTKMFITSSLRKWTRIVLTILSIAASICLLIFVFTLMSSKNEGINMTFSRRYKYDCLIFYDGSEEFYNKIKQYNEIEKIEKINFYWKDIKFGEKKESVQVSAIGDESDLINLYNTNNKEILINNGIIIDEGLANRFNIKKGDIVALDDKEIIVDDISRQFVNPIQYISLNSELDNNTSAIAIKLKNNSYYNDFCLKACKIDGYNYTVNSKNQAEDMKIATISIDTAVYAFAAFAIVAGFIIIYNMSVISIKEKLREYATLIALGVSRTKIIIINFKESIVQFIIATIIGIPIGIPVTYIILKAMSVVSYQLPVVNLLNMILLSVGLTLIYTIIANIISSRKIINIQPDVVLNSRE